MPAFLSRRRLMLAIPAAGALSALGPLSAFASRPIRHDRASFFALASVGSALLAAGERGVLARSTDHGQGWTVSRLPTTRNFTTVIGQADGIALVAGHGGVIYRSVDAGLSWQPIPDGTLDQVNPDREPILCGLIDRSGAVWLGGAFGTLLRSDDQGARWRRMALPDAAFDRHIYGLFETSAGRFRWLVGESGALFRAALHQPWIALDSPYEGSFFGGLATPEGAPLVFGMRGAIYRGESGGESWRQCPCPRPIAWMAGRVLTDRRIVLAGDQGWLAISEDDGRSVALHQVAESSVSDLWAHADGTLSVAGVQGLQRWTGAELKAGRR